MDYIRSSYNDGSNTSHKKHLNHKSKESEKNNLISGLYLFSEAKRRSTSGVMGMTSGLEFSWNEGNHSFFTL